MVGTALSADDEIHDRNQKNGKLISWKTIYIAYAWEKEY